MATTGNGYRYPLTTDPPATAVDMQHIADDLDTWLTSFNWQPVYGGGSGATLGSDGGTDGWITRNGKDLTYHGRILFGSSAVFGGGVVSGAFQIGGLDVRWSFGTGWYHPLNTASVPRPLMLIPASPSEYSIRVIRDAGLVALSSIGAPSQSDQIHFEIKGILA